MIERWIDIDSPEFKQVEQAHAVRKLTLRSLELQIVVPDKNGYLYTVGGLPLNAELNGKTIGLRYSAKAAN
jgi:hypothetical protein